MENTCTTVIRTCKHNAVRHGAMMDITLLDGDILNKIAFQTWNIRPYNYEAKFVGIRAFEITDTEYVHYP